MYPIYIVMFFVSIIGFMNMDKLTNAPDENKLRAEAIAMNEIVYATAVKDYVIANPSASGTIAQASLGLPTWYNNLGWTNNVTDGVITIYPTNLAFLKNNTEISWKLLEKTGNSLLVGVNRGGQFYNPVTGINASVAIPAGVPANSPVFILTTR